MYVADNENGNTDIVQGLADNQRNNGLVECCGRIHGRVGDRHQSHHQCGGEQRTVSGCRQLAIRDDGSNPQPSQLSLATGSAQAAPTETGAWRSAPLQLSGRPAQKLEV